MTTHTCAHPDTHRLLEKAPGLNDEMNAIFEELCNEPEAHRADRVLELLKRINDIANQVDLLYDGLVFCDEARAQFNYADLPDDGDDLFDLAFERLPERLAEAVLRDGITAVWRRHTRGIGRFGAVVPE